MLRVTVIAALLIGSVFSSHSVEAGAAWYVGKVQRVALISADGSFIVTFKNGALANCQHRYAYFIGSELGENRLKSAYAIALASIAGSMDMGIVIDKAKNGEGGRCNAVGMTADLRAN